MVDRLRKLGTVINELPVWPFDLGTLRQFLSAYVTPALGAILLKGVDLIEPAMDAYQKIHK